MKVLVTGVSGQLGYDAANDVVRNAVGAESGAEGKRHNDVVDEDEEPTDSIIKYRRDPMDFIPKSFTKRNAFSSRSMDATAVSCSVSR